MISPVLFVVILLFWTIVLSFAWRLSLRARDAENRRATRLLAESKERLQLALDGADEALWDWKIQEHTSWYSDRWAEMLGYSAAEIGDSVDIWERLVHPDDFPETWAKLQSHIAGRSDSYQAEFRMRAKSGEWRWIHARAGVAERLADGTATRVAGTHLDITEQRRAAHDLAEARNAALEASRAKSTFLANMSHEIRTPMNGIIGISELLYESAPDARTKEYADILRTSGSALLTILNDILDFSKIEAGKMQVERTPFALRSALVQTVDLFALAAARKGIALSAQFDASAPDWVIGDSGRLRQVVMNLIGNAMKFTETGSVTVRCRPDDLGRLLFEVADTGPGIAPEALRRLFHPFTQADSSITRRHGGTGLGLAISRQLVELMGGRLEAVSMPGSGSTFRFSLPFAACAEAQSRAGASSIAPAARGARILLAEDNVVNQKVALHMLARLGHTADTVTTGHAALEWAKKGCYDAILMDCQMPEMSGYEASTLLRAHFGEGPRPSIIALTANSMESDREACLAAGMDDHVAKPVTLAALAAALERNGVVSQIGEEEEVRS
jgi:PAS domain S-box-containing protein